MARPVDNRGYISTAVAMMSTSHIVTDKVTRATYMDTVTTSVGWVTLDWRTTLQDVRDLI